MTPPLASVCSNAVTQGCSPGQLREDPVGVLEVVPGCRALASGSSRRYCSTVISATNWQHRRPRPAATSCRRHLQEHGLLVLLPVAPEHHAQQGRGAPCFQRDVKTR